MTDLHYVLRDAEDTSPGYVDLQDGPEYRGGAAPMAISEANAIAAIQALTSFSVQTSAEATAVTNTTANILYATASRTQGNFTVFLEIAEDQQKKINDPGDWQDSHRADQHR